MKLPKKVVDSILEEANKNARFSWYSGWEKSSGYIKSDLRDDNRYGSVRIYIKWEKKKPPTDVQVKEEIGKYVERIQNNECHSQDQKDFRHFILNNYYVDVRRLKHEAINSVEDNLTKLLSILEKSEEFTEPSIQNLFNDLKNLEAGVNDHAAVERFLDEGRKRIGES